MEFMFLPIFLLVANYCYASDKAFEGSYGDCIGTLVYAEKMNICHFLKSYSYDYYVVRLMDTNFKTTGFMECSYDYSCHYYLGNGMYGESRFELSYFPHVPLKGEMTFNPQFDSDVSSVSFSLTNQLQFSKINSSVPKKSCIAQYINIYQWGDYRYDVVSIYGNGTFHMCSRSGGYQREGAFVGLLDIEGHPSIQMYGHVLYATGGGHWFSIEKNSYSYGGVLLASGIDGDRNKVQISIFSGVEFDSPRIYNLMRTDYDESNTKLDDCLDISQINNGVFEDDYFGVYSLMNINGNFFGYFNNPGWKEPTLSVGKGILVGKYNRNLEIATGNCYSINSYENPNNTFYIHFKKLSGVIRCLSDSTLNFQFQNKFTNVWDSFALLGYDVDSEYSSDIANSNFDIVGEYVQNGKRNLSVCRRNHSDHVIVSFHDYDGYQEGLSHENNRIVVSAYADKYNGNLRSGTFVFVKMAPTNYYIQGIRGISISYGNDDIEEYDYVGCFPNTPKISNSLIYKSNGNTKPWYGVYSQCVVNTRPVPFSPFKDFVDPTPIPTPKKKKEVFKWWSKWWFIFICSLTGFCLLGGFVYVLTRIIRTYRKKAKLRKLARENSERDIYGGEYAAIEDENYNDNDNDDDNSNSPLMLAEDRNSGGNSSINAIDSEVINNNPDLLNNQNTYDTFPNENIVVLEEPEVVENLDYKPLQPVSNFGEGGGTYSPYQSDSLLDSNIREKNEDTVKKSEYLFGEKKKEKKVTFESEPVSEELKVDDFTDSVKMVLFFNSSGNTWEVVFELIFDSTSGRFVVNENNNLGFQNNHEIERVSPRIFENDIREVMKRINWNLTDITNILQTVNQEWSWKCVKWVLQKE